MISSWSIVVGLGFLLITSVLFNVILLFSCVWFDPSRFRTFLLNLLVSVFTLFYTLLIAEFVVFLMFVETDSLAFTLASQRWMKKYWTPLNSLGYRDVEHRPALLQGRKTVFVVGDSFVAGLGIKNYQDRFSGGLQTRLGDCWVVLNVAKNGWHTNQEFEAIRSHPIKPDVIVLSWYVNDIEGAALKHGVARPVLIKHPPALIRPLVENSYLMNLVYWRLYRLGSAESLDIYYRYHESSFANDVIWRTHAAELLEIAAYTRTRGIGLVVVVFPRLTAIAQMAPFIARVVELFRMNGVTVVNMAEQLVGREPNQLIVSNLDPHPSIALHREVADLLVGPVLLAADESTTATAGSCYTKPPSKRTRR